MTILLFKFSILIGLVSFLSFSRRFRDPGPFIILQARWKAFQKNATPGRVLDWFFDHVFWFWVKASRYYLNMTKKKSPEVSVPCECNVCSALDEDDDSYNGAEWEEFFESLAAYKCPSCGKVLTWHWNAWKDNIPQSTRNWSHYLTGTWGTVCPMTMVNRESLWL